MVLLEQEVSTGLVPPPGNCAPMDCLKRVLFYFIPQHQVITLEHVQSVDRQQIQIQVAPVKCLQERKNRWPAQGLALKHTGSFRWVPDFYSKLLSKWGFRCR